MIRKLNPEIDIDLYRQAWGWLESYPRRLKDALAAYAVETFDEYLELVKGPRATIGIFDVDLLATLTVELTGSGVYEIHLTTPRKSRINHALLEGLMSIQKTLFEEMGARFVFAFTPSWNRGVVRLASLLGLKEDGVRKLKSLTGQPVVVWSRVSQTKEDYEFKIQDDANAAAGTAASPEPVTIGNEQLDKYVHSGLGHSRHQQAA